MISNDYPLAGVPGKAQPEVVEAVERFRSLPAEQRNRMPLLYWLLGAGTPVYKMDKEASAYGPTPPGRKGEICGNCRFAYARVLNGQLICSQIEGDIAWKAWCRFWKGHGGKAVAPRSWRTRLRKLIVNPNR